MKKVFVLILLFIEPCYGQTLTKVETQEQFDHINRILERAHLQNPSADDALIIRRFGFDPYSYLEFGMVRRDSAGTPIKEEPRDTIKWGFGIACRPNLFQLAGQNTTSPYYLGDLPSTAFVAGSYVKYMKLTEFAADIIHSLIDRDQYREDLFFEVLLETAEMGAEATIKHQDESSSPSDLATIERFANLVSSTYDLARNTPSGSSSEFSLNLLIEDINRMDVSSLKSEFGGEELLVIEEFQRETIALEMRLELQYEVSAQEGLLFGAKTAVDGLRALYYVAKINASYEGAFEDLNLVRDFTSDNAIGRAAARARTALVSYWNAVLEKATLSSDVTGVQTFTNTGIFALLQTLKALSPNLTAGMTGGMLIWDAASFAFGNLDEEFRKAGFAGQIEAVVHRATFGTLREQFLTTGQDSDGKRFRSGLRFTMLIEAYGLARIGRGFLQIGSNMVSEAIYNSMKSAFEYKDKSDFQRLGNETIDLSKKPLAVFQSIASNDCRNIVFPK